MGLYEHVYGGKAVDMSATREEVIQYVGYDPALFWAPNCKVIDKPYQGGELVVHSTDDPDKYRVTHIMR